MWYFLFLTIVFLAALADFTEELKFRPELMKIKNFAVFVFYTYIVATALSILIEGFSPNEMFLGFVLSVFTVMIAAKKLNHHHETKYNGPHHFNWLEPFLNIF